MTDLEGVSASPGGDARSVVAQLADRASPRRPDGSVGVLLNRMMVYTRPKQVPNLQPHISTERSGFVLAGANTNGRMRLLEDSGYDGVVLVDPAAYEKHVATPDAPFWIPEDQMLPMTLDEMLNQQLVAGVTAAITPTKFIRAGDTDSLKAAARQVKALGRNDVIFAVPLDVSLLDRRYIRQVTAILVDVGRPVGLVLGGQLDPLTHAASRIIQNLRLLAATIDLFPMRTDFNAFDLVAHGAFAGAIGISGAVRHAVEPPQPALFIVRDPSPSVLVPELMCWWKGSKLGKLFGARQNLIPRCPCAVCGSKRLSRFQRQADENEAVAHAVATWSGYATDMLDAPTMRLRAQYWKNICTAALENHVMFAKQLKRPKPIKPQTPLKVWAQLPLWLTD
ncbi:hypothetical protein LWC34_45415 [Kibdelosporangium philippinense]|uniref:tRNA-guanine(15) transglycosylase-like domain-containing protein n=1 Tax=Kibdelosporangium philippinense TaxID=211113 RepID=A0ABS8ZR02_9PSEU|nr:hypothetical protein [Kibdelosporangium philippinense]MCE7009999.1 hypothetical protein [Kibdelosporangium philippinense]